MIGVYMYRNLPMEVPDNYMEYKHYLILLCFSFHRIF